MNEKPTVVRVITWLPVGGIERRLVAVAPMLRDLGWNVRVVCLREEGPLGEELRAAGIPLKVIPFSSRLSPPAIRNLSRYFQEQQASVVHAHMYRSNVPATIAGRLARVPAIFGQIHNVESWDSRRQEMMDRFVARWRTATITVSKAVQRDAMATLRVPESKAPILYNGIDVGRFAPDAEAGTRVRQEWGVPEEAVLFVVPARLHPQKNPLGIARAAEKAAEEMAGTATFRLAFVGKGKLEEELKKQAEESPHRDVFLFPGQRDDMPAVYNAADVMILSSFKEGFSNAVVEALACGKPVIASDAGGNKEAISDSRYGWIHDPGDAEALAAQMAEAGRKGRVGLAGMADECRGRGEKFSLEALVHQTHHLYRQALGWETET